jgi:hypothetical protein
MATTVARDADLVPVRDLRFGLRKGEVSARGATYREGAVLLLGGE